MIYVHLPDAKYGTKAELCIRYHKNQLLYMSLKEAAVLAEEIIAKIGEAEK